MNTLWSAVSEPVGFVIMSAITAAALTLAWCVCNIVRDIVRTGHGHRVIVDIETTGLNAHAERIIEIAMIRVNAKGREVRRFVSLVNPNRDTGATEIHGITDAMVMNAPAFADIAGTVRDMMSGATFVAHNVDFDLPFIVVEMHRAGMKAPKVGTFCTLGMSRLMFTEGRHNLKATAERFGIHVPFGHRAEVDAEVTLAIFRRMMGIGA